MGDPRTFPTKSSYDTVSRPSTTKWGPKVHGPKEVPVGHCSALMLNIVKKRKVVKDARKAHCRTENSLPTHVVPRPRGHVTYVATKRTQQRRSPPHTKKVRTLNPFFYRSLPPVDDKRSEPPNTGGARQETHTTGSSRTKSYPGPLQRTSPEERKNRS